MRDEILIYPDFVVPTTSAKWRGRFTRRINFYAYFYGQHFRTNVNEILILFMIK